MPGQRTVDPAQSATPAADGDHGAEARPKRLSQTDILRSFIERMARAGGEHSSVELTRNAKGDTQIKVAVRTGESEEVQTIEQAAAKARETYDSLRLIYPPSSIEPEPAPAAVRASTARRRTSGDE